MKSCWGPTVLNTYENFSQSLAIDILTPVSPVNCCNETIKYTCIRVKILSLIFKDKEFNSHKIFYSGWVQGRSPWGKKNLNIKTVLVILSLTAGQLGSPKHVFSLQAWRDLVEIDSEYEKQRITSGEQIHVVLAISRFGVDFLVDRITRSNTDWQNAKTEPTKGSSCPVLFQPNSNNSISKVDCISFTFCYVRMWILCSLHNAGKAAH